MRPPARCGTRSGYDRHRRVLGEEACDACKAALSDYFRKRRVRGGSQAHHLPAPPPTFARCRRGCGRLVWDFDAGLCGACSESEAA